MNFKILHYFATKHPSIISYFICGEVVLGRQHFTSLYNRIVYLLFWLGSLQVITNFQTRSQQVTKFTFNRSP